MENKKKCTNTDCVAGQRVQPIGEFDNQPMNKDGLAYQCKSCRRAYQVKRNIKKVMTKTGHEPKPVHKTKNKEITEDSRNFYRLGILTGESRFKGRCKDLQKALNIEKRANRRLLEVIIEGDARDYGAATRKLSPFM